MRVVHEDMDRPSIVDQTIDDGRQDRLRRDEIGVARERPEFAPRRGRQDLREHGSQIHQKPGGGGVTRVGSEPRNAALGGFQHLVPLDERGGLAVSGGRLHNREPCRGDGLDRLARFEIFIELA